MLRRTLRRSLALPLLMALAVAMSACPARACGGPEQLQVGYQQMYNLDFTAAHEVFQSWQHSHPEDPLGFVSDAAAYLFGEFNRLHILQFQLFTDDSNYQAMARLSPDPKVKTAFEFDLAQSDRLAQEILREHPSDHEAIFAEVLANGLRGDYLALIVRKNLAALSYMKNSRVLAERLLSLSPQCYDAYLAVGAENYLLSLKPAPVRWFLQLTGAETDRERGIARLQLAAQKGHYLAPYARLLLAVAALRDHDLENARRLLTDLAHDFPRNYLYQQELARISPMGTHSTLAHN